MPDRETVITHLQIIHTWAEFARKRDLQFFTAKHLENIAQWADDALDLLKEQEAEISKISNAYLDLVGKASKQPQIVRCKDCKHFDGIDCRVNDIANIMDTDWFCADGRKRDGHPERNLPDREAGDGVPGGDDSVLAGSAVE